MSEVIGIIGTGTASSKIIHDSLNDLPLNATFIVPWDRSPGLELVYDWLLDNERTFKIAGVPARVLAQAAEEVIPAQGNVHKAVLRSLPKSSTRVLVMWQDEGLDELIIEAAAAGKKILELTNGLAPIEVEDMNPSDSTKDDEDENPQPLTSSELESMPIAALKRMAVNQGIDIKGLSREEIISQINSPTASDSESTEIIDDLLSSGGHRSLEERVSSLEQTLVWVVAQLALNQ